MTWSIWLAIGGALAATGAVAAVLAELPALPGRAGADSLTSLVSLLGDQVARLAGMFTLGWLAGRVAFLPSDAGAANPRWGGRAAQLWLVSSLLMTFANPAFSYGLPLGYTLRPDAWWTFLTTTPSALAWLATSGAALAAVILAYRRGSGPTPRSWYTLAWLAGASTSIFVAVTGNVSVGLDHDFATDAMGIATGATTLLTSGAIGVLLLAPTAPEAVASGLRRYQRAMPGLLVLAIAGYAVVAWQQLAGVSPFAVAAGAPVVVGGMVFVALLLNWCWREFRSLRPVRTDQDLAGSARAHSAQADSTQTDTAQSDSAQPDTAQSDSTQPDTAQADSTQPDTAQADSTQTDPAQTDPARTSSAHASAVQTSAVQTSAVQTSSTQTSAVQTSSTQTSSTQTSAAQTSLAPTSPARPSSVRTGPAQTDPARLTTGVGRDVVGWIVFTACLTAALHLPPPRFEIPQSAQENYLGYEVNLPATVERLAGLGRPNLLWAVLVAVAVGGYVWAMVRVHRRGGRWPVARLLGWLAGWLLTGYLAVSGLWMYSTAVFSWHMLVHMTVNMMVPVLCVLGAPLSLVEAAARERGPGEPPGPRELLAELATNRLVRGLVSPPVVWLVYVSSLFVVYLTPLFEWLMRYHWAHQLMLLYFMAAGYAFFALVIGPDRHPWRLPHLVKFALLVSVMPFHAIFAVGIMSAHSIIGGNYYRTIEVAWVGDLLADQNVAGQITWFTGEIPAFIAVLALAAQWFRSDSRQAAREDERTDAGGEDELAAYNQMLAELAERDRAERDRAERDRAEHDLAEHDLADHNPRPPGGDPP